MGAGASGQGQKGKNRKGQDFCLQICHAHETAVNCLAISDDGLVLISGSDDATAVVWRADNVPIVKYGVLEGHKSHVRCVQIDYPFCFTASSDKTIKKWYIPTTTCMGTMTGHTGKINRLMDIGDRLVSSATDGMVISWDYENCTAMQVFKGHQGGVYPLLFLPQFSPTDVVDQDHIADDEKWKAIGVDIPDLLLSGSADMTARVWCFQTGVCCRELRGHQGAITCMTWDDDATQLMTGAVDKTIRSWNIARGEQIRVFDGHSAAIINIKFHAKQLFTASSDQTIRIWVPAYGETIRCLKGHSAPVTAMNFYENFVVSGCGDGEVRVFEHSTVKRSFQGHQSSVTTFLMYADRLYSCSCDGTIRIWSLKDINEPLVTKKVDSDDEFESESEEERED